MIRYITDELEMFLMISNGEQIKSLSCFLINIIITHLTHLFSVYPFSAPCKYQKTLQFLDVFQNDWVKAQVHFLE